MRNAELILVFNFIIQSFLGVSAPLREIKNFVACSYHNSHSVTSAAKQSLTLLRGYTVAAEGGNGAIRI